MPRENVSPPQDDDRGITRAELDDEGQRAPQSGYHVGRRELLLAWYPDGGLGGCGRAGLRAAGPGCTPARAVGSERVSQRSLPTWSMTTIRGILGHL